MKKNITISLQRCSKRYKRTNSLLPLFKWGGGEFLFARIETVNQSGFSPFENLINRSLPMQGVKATNDPAVDMFPFPDALLFL